MTVTPEKAAGRPARSPRGGGANVIPITLTAPLRFDIATLSEAAITFTPALPPAYPAESRFTIQ